MVVATTTYLYTDVNLNPYYVQGSQLTDRGPWSSLASYAPPDVVQIGVDQYYALAPNTNMPPSGIVDENWSTLVIVEEANTVVTVLQKGSLIADRVLRPALVTVAAPK